MRAPTAQHRPRVRSAAAATPPAAPHTWGARRRQRAGALAPVPAPKHLPSPPGDVIGLGDGRLADGSVRPFFLKEGQTVLYSKFGFMYQDLKLGDSELILIREDDVIGIMPR